MSTLAALLVPAPVGGQSGLEGLAAAALGIGEGGLTARVDRLQPRGGRLSVGLDVAYPWAGEARRDYLVASDAPAALDAARAGRAALLRPVAIERDDDDDDARSAPDAIAVWRHPADPELPGLAAACTLDRVRDLLPQAASVAVATYRPLRRAVVQVARADGAPIAYLKVVPPRRTATLRARHQLVATAPRLLDPPAGSAAEEGLAPGVLALAPVAGSLLASALAAGSAVPTLADLRPRSARGLPEIPAIAAPTSWADSALAGGVDTLLAPHVRRRRRALVRAAAAAWEASRSAAAGAGLVHGDLHPGNVVVAGERVVGHLDLDRAGTGLLVDDDACLLAHTAVLGFDHPAALGALTRWWDEVAARGDATLAAVRARTAAVLLTLVPTLPHRAEDVFGAVERLLDAGPPGPPGEHYPTQKEKE